MSRFKEGESAIHYYFIDETKNWRHKKAKDFREESDFRRFENVGIKLIGCDIWIKQISREILRRNSKVKLMFYLSDLKKKFNG